MAQTKIAIAALAVALLAAACGGTGSVSDTEAAPATTEASAPTTTEAAPAVTTAVPAPVTTEATTTTTEATVVTTTEAPPPTTQAAGPLANGDMLEERAYRTGRDVGIGFWEFFAPGDCYWDLTTREGRTLSNGNVSGGHSFFVNVTDETAVLEVKWCLGGATDTASPAAALTDGDTTEERAYLAGRDVGIGFWEFFSPGDCYWDLTTREGRTLSNGNVNEGDPFFVDITDEAMVFEVGPCR